MTEQPVKRSASNVLVSVCAITIMCIYAVFHGTNGSIVYAAIVAVAGLGGYELREQNKGR